MDLIRASLHSFEDSRQLFWVCVLEGLGCFEIGHPTSFFFFFLYFTDLQGILEEWISSAQNERISVIRWTIPLIWRHSLNVWNSFNKLMFMQRLTGALSSYVSNGKGKFKYFMYSSLSLSVFKRCKCFMLK